MALPPEAAAQLETFTRGTQIREVQLGYLLENLEIGLELVTDIDRVNDVLSQSTRPELVMTEPVPQYQITWPFNLSTIDNFAPRMQAFGPRVYKKEKSWRTGEIEDTFVGRRPANPNEKEVYRLLAGRSDFEKRQEFAASQGIDLAIADDIYAHSLASDEAFGRMYVLLPTLTETLMDWCIDDSHKFSYRDKAAELYVGYSIMSKLVDRTDVFVVKRDGSLDDRRLCH